MQQDFTPSIPADETGGAPAPVVSVQYPTWYELPENARAEWSALLAQVTVPPLLIDLTASNMHIDDFDPRELAAKVSHDAVLAGVILAAANSAKYGLLTPITAVPRAIVHLGFVMVKATIASYQMEATFGRMRGVPGAHLRYVRRWSTVSSVLAHHWAQAADLPEPSSVSTLALLSLLGSLMLGMGEPKPDDGYRLIADEGTRLAYEQQVWGVTTPLLSAALSRQWKLPETISHHLEQLWEPVARPVDKDSEAPIVIAASALALAGPFLRNNEVDPAEVFGRPGNSGLKANLDSNGLFNCLTSIWGTNRIQRELGAAASES